MTEPYRIREWTAETDLSFVANSWRESYYAGSPAVFRADRDHYRSEMQRLFDLMLPRAKVLVACDSTDEDTLLGFAAARGDELHYVYVRGGPDDRSCRRQGIAKALVEAHGCIRAYTFMTTAGMRRIDPVARGWKFTPRFTLS